VRSGAGVSLACLLLTGPVMLRAEGAIYVLPSGHAIDSQGNVVAEGLPVTGARRDQVVGNNGQIYAADALDLNKEGQLVGADGGRVQPGQSRPATPIPQAGTSVAAVKEKPYQGPGVKMVVGGQSEEGVAKTTTLPILK